MTTLQTHDEWQAEITRLLDLAERRPANAPATLLRLAKAVERAMLAGINDWHLVQTLQRLSLAHARAGDHARAAKTLGDLAEHHHALATEHRRAGVAAAAASALHLAKAGDVVAARKLLRRAERLAQGLTPKDQLVRSARTFIAALKRS